MNSEHKEQTMLINWFRLQYPRYNKCLFAIPNGGARHIRTAIKLKEEGLLAGVSDLFLMIARDGKHGMFIEMKTKKGKLQQNQIEFLAQAEVMGYATVVAFGFDDAQKNIINYLNS